MGKKLSNFMFWGMKNIGLPIRNILMPPQRLLQDVRIKKGSCVLDYGCGPGVFTKQLSELAGKSGKVYALDNHPMALKTVEKLANRTGLENVVMIMSGGDTQLPKNSIDVAVMFDVLHILDNGAQVLGEIQRVLKPGCMLYLSDHHMEKNDIQAKVADYCSLRLIRQSKYIMTYKQPEC